MTTLRHQTCGLCLLKWRTEAALSQFELAQLAGVSCRTVGGIERDEQVGSLRVVRALAKALGVAPTALIHSECATSNHLDERAAV